MATLGRRSHVGDIFIVKTNTKLYSEIQKVLGFVPKFTNLGEYVNGDIKHIFTSSKGGKIYHVRYDDVDCALVAKIDCKEITWEKKVSNDELEIPFVLGFLFGEDEWNIFENKSPLFKERVLSLCSASKEIYKSKHWDEVYKRWSSEPNLLEKLRPYLLSVRHFKECNLEMFKKRYEVVFADIKRIKSCDLKGSKESTADMYLVFEDCTIVPISLKKKKSAMVGALVGKMEELSNFNRMVDSKLLMGLVETCQYDKLYDILDDRYTELETLVGGIDCTCFLGRRISRKSYDFNDVRMCVCNCMTLGLFIGFYKSILKELDSVSIVDVMNKRLATLWAYSMFGSSKYPLYRLYGADETNPGGTYEYLGYYEEVFGSLEEEFEKEFSSVDVRFVVSCRPVEGSYYNIEMFIAKRKNRFVRTRTSPKSSDSYMSSFVVDSDEESKLKTIDKLTERVK